MLDEAAIVALARKFERMVKSREIANFTELAVRSGLTKARVSQLMDLTLLAPDVRKEILRLKSADGIEPITERKLRDLVRLEGWGEQRREWAKLCARMRKPTVGPTLAS